MRSNRPTVINETPVSSAICLKLIRRSLTPDLDQRAITAASHAKFKPGLKGGKPVPVEVTVEVQFDPP